MQITTVDQLVSVLLAKRVRFSLTPFNEIRADGACPLFALDGAEPEYDVSLELVEAIVAAADAAEGHDPAIRARLLGLVQGVQPTERLADA